MPTFIKPAWVHVEPRGGGGLGAILAAGAAVGAVIWVVQEIEDFLFAIVVGTAGIALGAAVAVGVLLYRTRGKAIAPGTVKPPRTIPPAPVRAQIVHHHEHLHIEGVTAAQITQAVRQLHEVPAITAKETTK